MKYAVKWLNNYGFWKTILESDDKEASVNTRDHMLHAIEEYGHPAKECCMFEDGEVSNE